MNKAYPLVWNTTTTSWNITTATTRRHDSSRMRLRRISTALLLGMGCSAPAFALPGGPVLGGTATGVDIHANTAGTQMSINQHVDKAIINWNSFDIAKGQTVTFSQPSSTSIALNRVTGVNGTRINGNLQANGRVFILNPNGVVFGETAQVNVAGLLASTAQLSDADFLAGTYRLTDASRSEIRNAGTLIARDGGILALLGNDVSNDGQMQAQNGQVALAAGRDFLLTLDGSPALAVQINIAALKALVANRGVLKADGGTVSMAARTGELALQTVVNNGGIIEAMALHDQNGRIVLDGGSNGGVVVGGRLVANAMNVPGNGGSVEMRGRHVQTRPGVDVDTRSSNGQTGHWHIAAQDIAVDNTALSPDTTIHTDTLSQNLGRTRIHLQATGGDVHMNGPITWTSNNALTLTAAGAVRADGALTATGTHALLTLDAGDAVQVGGHINLTGSNAQLAINAANGYQLGAAARITLPGVGSAFHFNGGRHHIIRTLDDLKSIDGNLGGRYVLGNDITFRGKVKSIGSEIGTFSGSFDGFGNTLTGFVLTSTGSNYGLFAASSGAINNLRMAGFRVAPTDYNVALLSIGTLVGYNSGSISNVQATGLNVAGSTQRSNVIGGLVGTNFGGRIHAASTSGNVTGTVQTLAMGGLVGQNLNGSGGVGEVLASHSSVTVGGRLSSLGNGGAGGLVGINAGLIRQGDSKGMVTTATMGVNTGGLLGANLGGTVEHSHSSSTVKSYSDGYTGGLVGLNREGTLSLSTASGNVTANGGGRPGGATGGLLGHNGSGGQLVDVRASGAVNDYHGSHVGGLVGSNAGDIRIAEATGKVLSSASRRDVRSGGLAGSNSGNIAFAVARGDVSGGIDSNVGGLVGHNTGTLDTVDYVGNISAGTNSSAGGVVGLNEGEITSATAGGTVKGNANSRIGGIAGENRRFGKVTFSSSSNTLGSLHDATLGGLVGLNQGLVEYSSTSSNIEVKPNRKQVYGGLVGVNQGVMRRNSAIGHAALLPESGTNAGQILP